MNSRKPASLHFSLAGFFRRGGETDEHADGWGIAYYDEDACHLFVDENPAARSPIAQQLQQREMRSRNMIAHIRKATQGPVAPINCHPFSRMLWGREWVFAHNGNIDTCGLPQPQQFIPMGQTDSERAFCVLLDAMSIHFPEAPAPTALADFLTGQAWHIGQHGRFNFMLSDGGTLFARRATNLHYVERAYPFGCARLLDCPVEIDFARHNHSDDRMIIVATQPLTNEEWIPLPVDEVVAFKQGARCASHERTPERDTQRALDASH